MLDSVCLHKQGWNGRQENRTYFRRETSEERDILQTRVNEKRERGLEKPPLKASNANYVKSMIKGRIWSAKTFSLANASSIRYRMLGMSGKPNMAYWG